MQIWPTSTIGFLHVAWQYGRLPLVVAAVSYAIAGHGWLRRWVTRHVLVECLRPLRVRGYIRVGLRTRAGRLQQQLREEADLLIADPSHQAVEKNPLMLADVVGDERIQLIEALKTRWIAAECLYGGANIAVAIFIAGGCWLLCCLSHLQWLLIPPALANDSGGSMGFVLISGAVVGSAAFAFEILRRGRRPEFDDTSEIEARLEEGKRAQFLAGQATIGGPGKIVRSLHLSAGGFDTVMQLGCAHALCVIQGRAPDAIVGVSAGAIQGAAIAEILQSSEPIEKAAAPCGWAALSDLERGELQATCLLARVHTLRHFIEATQRAPERLVDALTPDPYQINGRAALEPLRQPLFPEEERAEKDKLIQSQSGIIRLYNDLLDAPFSVGALTRFVRRLLGLKAAGDVRNPGQRVIVYGAEVLQLVLLVGFRLMEVARLLPIFRPALRHNPHRKQAATGTAGAVLSQSRFPGWTRTKLRFAIPLLFLLVAWTLVSIILVLPAILVCVGASVYHWKDRDNRMAKQTFSDVRVATIWFLCITLFWIAVTLGVFFVLGLALAVLPALFAMGPETLFQDLLTHAKFRNGLLHGAEILGVMSVIVVFISPLIIYRGMRSPRRMFNSLLAAYGLDDSILTEHGLRSFFVDLFDYGFYKRAPMEDVVDAALNRRASVEEKHCKEPRPVGWFSMQARLQPIHVGLAVADTATGRLEVVPRMTDLVKGLLAAVAFVPWMPGQELRAPPDIQKRRRDSLFIDGSNVSNEPTRALMGMLRDRMDDKSKAIHIYSVTPFPISQPAPAANSAGGRQTPRKLWLNLIDITLRALYLQRLRDATLERRFTELFSEMIPPGKFAVQVDGKRTFRAWVAPIELEADANVNRRILGASKDNRRRLLYETIADGCRASLQVFIARSVQELASRRTGDYATWVPCAMAVKHNFGASQIPEALRAVGLPGTDPRLGPGLSEICENCCLGRGSNNPRSQALEARAWAEVGPSWPHERATDPDSGIGESERFRSQQPPLTQRELVRDAMVAAAASGRMPWPRKREADPAKPPEVDRKRPTVSLLFSGGVFRGVYQLGVLNALNQMQVRPDLIAGASVGSITAAMAADAFAQPSPPERQARISRLASVYLAIDRLVLTDRMADFVRNLTLRAADTRFSIREADRVFRKYDLPLFAEFDRNTRRVVAGIERLLYVSPYELNQLIRALRTHDPAESLPLLQKMAQQFLDRMQVGEEALGTEALERLIAEYVVGSRASEHPAGFTIDELRLQTGIQLLATATNLTDGRLDVLGESPASTVRESPILKEVLLASSAFPGVFRPRWSWEAFPGTPHHVQYIDGGVTDNLPLDAVAQYLERAASAKLIEPSPQSPHLVIAASLEVIARPYLLDFTRNKLKENWMILTKRAKQLGYNRKLHTYSAAQERMRGIASQLSPSQRESLNFTPVDMKVIAIKPNLLCSTFGFHPMLGFRRSSQAASIAHGCASTMLTFSAHRSSLQSWGIDASSIPEEEDWAAAFERERKQGDGLCWLNDKPCPFSRGALREMNDSFGSQGTPAAANTGRISETMIQGLQEIHRLCSQKKTHLRLI